MPAPVRRRVTPPAALPVAVATAAAALVAGLLLGGGAPTAAPAGLPDPGPVVGWGRPAAQVAALLAAVVTVGSLLVAAVLAPTGSSAARRSRRTAATGAWAWAGLLLLGLVLDAAEVAGVRLHDVDLGVLRAWLDQPGAQGPLLVAALVALVAASLPSVRTPGASRALLLLALLAAAVLALEGHAGGDGEMVQSGIVVHVLGALLWTGGLTGLLLDVRHDTDALRQAAPRFSRLALLCFLAVAGSGLLTVLVTLPWRLSGWTGGYAAIVAAKTFVLLVLGAAGHRHRTRTLPLLERGHPRGLLRLAAGEVVVMSAGLGLAAALGRTPLPASPTGSGHGHLGGDVGPVTWAGVLTESRPNAVVLLALGLLASGYVLATRSVRARGTAWPRRRTAAWCAALGAALVVTCSGLAAFAHTHPSLLVAQLLTMLVVVPALALLGRPVELARLAGWPFTAPPWLDGRAVTPAGGAVSACALLLVLQHTRAIELAFASPWYHLLLLAVVTTAGTAMLWPSLGVERARAWTPAERAGWLALVGLTLLVLAARLGFGDGLLAEDWYLEMRLRGLADPATDQRVAGLVAAVGGLALVVPLLRHLPGRDGRSDGAAQSARGGQSRSTTVPSSSDAPTGP